MIKTLVHSIIIKMYSFFIKEKENKLLFIPNQASAYDYVDIENYSFESVLTYLHYLITDEEALNNKKYEYVLVVYQEYQRYLPVPKDEDGKSLYKIIYYPLKKNIKEYFLYYKEYFSSHVLFTGSPFHDEKLKRKSQIEIDLTYYLPFKSDYLLRPKKEKKTNYVIAASNIAAQIDSLASRVPYDHYVPLGLPKWDNILRPRFSKEYLISLLGYGSEKSKIIVYLPTHRDYERDENFNRGYLGEKKEYDDLNELLYKNNSYLIIKTHLGQNLKGIVNLRKYSNIKLYESTRNFTIHDVLAYADFLITDYTSGYFDYIVKPRPALFYFYDKEKYDNTRGVSWHPVESICNGNICYNYDELVKNIKLFLDGNYPFNIEKYKLIQSLILGNNNTYSVCKRVYDFMLKNI